MLSLQGVPSGDVIPDQRSMLTLSYGVIFTNLKVKKVARQLDEFHTPKLGPSMRNTLSNFQGNRRKNPQGSAETTVKKVIAVYRQRSSMDSLRRWVVCNSLSTRRFCYFPKSIRCAMTLFSCNA